jgi:hypothetical protein
MTSRNDITGDAIATKGTSDAYRDNYDRIFGKKRPQLTEDIGPAESREEAYYRDELALEEMRTRL